MKSKFHNNIPLISGLILCVIFWLFIYLNNPLNIKVFNLGVSLFILLVFLASHTILNVLIIKKNLTNKIQITGFSSFLQWLVPILFIVIFGFLNLSNKSIAAIGIYISIGILFSILGFLLPKIKFNNYGIGLKFPWILNDKQAWELTHKRSSICWIIGGIIFTAFGFFPTSFLTVILSDSLFVVFIIVLPLVISIRARYHK